MTDDRILELLKLNDHATSGNGLALAFGLAIANEAASEEREACAKICEAHTVEDVLVGVGIAKSCATMIRMRSNVEHDRRPAASSQGVRVDGPVGPHAEDGK